MEIQKSLSQIPRDGDSSWLRQQGTIHSSWIKLDKSLPTPRAEFPYTDLCSATAKAEKCDFHKGEPGWINPRSRERDGALLSTGSTPGASEES